MIGIALGRKILGVAISLSAWFGTATGTVGLPKWFGDDMVLQSNQEYGARPFLNGRASPGETVTVVVTSVTNRNRTYTVMADWEEGFWKVQLEPAYRYREPLRIAITGNVNHSRTVVASNVRFGDVFLCAGQSNMQFPLHLVINATSEIDSLKDYVNFRFFVMARAMADRPQWDFTPTPIGCEVGDSCNQWVTQERAMAHRYAYISNFSAVCFLTVREIARLHTSIGSKRTVGLVQATDSGSRVEAWMSTQALQSTPYCKDVPKGNSPHNHPSVLYNAMIHPWQYFAIRATLWYQGEANADQKLHNSSIDPTDYYATLYQTMIADWRLRKGMGDFAWATVQLPPSVRSGTAPEVQAQTGRTAVRWAQQRTVPHPNGLTDISSLAVTLDLGGRSQWGYDHPPNKGEVARRLALGLLHAAYAQQDPPWTGPEIQRAGWQGADSKTVLVLTFSNTSSAEGMSLRDVRASNIDGSRNDCHRCCQRAPPFQVSNHQQPDTWSTVPWKDIGIRQNLLILDVSAIPFEPTHVRYAWTDYVECVLENSEGLVAGPFVQTIDQGSTRELRNSGPILAASSNRITSQSHKALETPPMGFNSWNFYHCNIDENIVKSVADAMVTTGLKDVGYQYVNIDDCWQVRRLSNGTIQPDPARFPSGMKALADYVHARGLLFGLYTASGSQTCQDRPGSFQYEEMDAETYCDWGLDYLKVDKCGGDDWPEANTSWIQFRKGLDACANRTGRRTILSVEYCTSVEGCGEWIAETANLWRTTEDIQATWSSTLSNIHQQEPMYTIARPGHYNDPDMLQIGNVGLTVDEQYSHMALWCIAGSPLLVGTDIIHASNTTLSILGNPEVIAINQDAGWNNVVQGHIVKSSTEGEIWAKRLSDGSWGVVLLNLNEEGSPLNVALDFTDLGMDDSTNAAVRDLWLRNDIGIFSGHFVAKRLRPHSSSFVRITPSTEETTSMAS